jgi:hypothetical protein
VTSPVLLEAAGFCQLRAALAVPPFYLRKLAVHHPYRLGRSRDHAVGQPLEAAVPGTRPNAVAQGGSIRGTCTAWELQVQATYAAPAAAPCW